MSETQVSPPEDWCPRCKRSGFELFFVEYRPGYADGSVRATSVCRDCRAQLLGWVEDAFKDAQPLPSAAPLTAAGRPEFWSEEKMSAPGPAGLGSEHWAHIHNLQQYALSLEARLEEVLHTNADLESSDAAAQRRANDLALRLASPTTPAAGGREEEIAALRWALLPPEVWDAVPLEEASAHSFTITKMLAALQNEGKP